MAPSGGTRLFSNYLEIINELYVEIFKGRVLSPSDYLELFFLEREVQQSNMY